MAHSDMFLKAVGQRTGVIAGESRDKTFTDQIDVVDWTWGMSSPSSVGGAAKGRRALKELTVHKRADRASTSLMAVLATNEILTSVTLSVRKAGGSSPLAYWVLKLEQARITGYDVESTVDSGGAPVLRESLSLSFKKISIDYVPQNQQGGGGGPSNFSDEVLTVS